MPSPLLSALLVSAAASILAALGASPALGQYTPDQLPLQHGQAMPFRNAAPPASPAEYAAFRAALSMTPAPAQVLALQDFLRIYPSSALTSEAQRWLRMAEMRAGIPPTGPAMDPGRVSPSAAPPEQAPAAGSDIAASPASAATSGPPLTAARPAIVEFGNGTLTIRADNSSLSQILREVANSSGMKLDGLSRDQRIYGNYGPGQPPDVLAALLDGSGYNIFMLGETDRGVPRLLSLSVRIPDNPSAPAANQPQSGDQQDDQAADDQAQPEAEQGPQERGFSPPPDPNGNQRTPQQMLDELRRLHQRGEAPPQQDPPPQ